MEYFTNNPEFQLLCCRTCQTMVTRKQVKVHLRSELHNLGIEAVKDAQAWTSKLLIFESQQEVQDSLPPRPDDAPPIVGLGESGTGGFRCKFVPDQSIYSHLVKAIT
jgi:hypothetical protein